METDLKKCDVCCRFQDPLGFKEMAGMDTCTACQINFDVNINQLVEVVKADLRKEDREAA